MADRYYLETPSADGRQAVLADSEAHHLAQVMRARPGDEIIVFDGRGGEWTARVLDVSRKAVRIELLSERPALPISPGRLIVGVALPKGERQRWLVEKAVELDVARLTPLAAARSVAEPVAGAIERLRRWGLEAAKQCGRRQLLDVTEGMTFPEFLEAHTSGLRLLADATGSPLAEQLRAAPTDGESTVIAIGPEGGFTGDERTLAQAAGWRQASLGPWTLRVETAVTAAAAIYGGERR